MHSKILRGQTVVASTSRDVPTHFPTNHFYTAFFHNVAQLEPVFGVTMVYPFFDSWIVLIQVAVVKTSISIQHSKEIGDNRWRYCTQSSS